MRKPDPVKTALEQLASLDLESLTEETIREIRDSLSSRYSLVVAKAAGICAERGLSQLVPDLIQAWPRHMKKLPKNDPNCAAKLALVDALYRLEEDCCELFLEAYRHVQMEGSYGPPVDTAAMMRGRALQALIANRHPDAGRMVVELLFDPWVEARSGAARAAVAVPEGEMLLRMKCRAGDTEAAVLGECFSGLLSIAPDESLPFVASYLDSGDPDLVVLSALALGESRREDAFPCLRDAWLGCPGSRQDFIIPIALLRRDEAFEFLVEQAAGSPPAFGREIYTCMEQAGSPQEWLDRLNAE